MNGRCGSLATSNSASPACSLSRRSPLENSTDSALPLFSQTWLPSASSMLRRSPTRVE
ncbi:hypothetical protein D3C84_1052980 [compost metagenome]